MLNETHQIPLTRIQKLIGRRMLQSKRTKPCFYIESKADVTELMAIRRKLRKSLGVRITTNTFYIRVLGLAAQKFPLTRGRFDGETISLTDEIPEQAKPFLSRLDANNDGFIDKEEMANAAQQMGGGSRSPDGEPRGPGRRGRNRPENTEAPSE